MSRTVSQFEISVMRFAIECDGNLGKVKLPSGSESVLEEYEGFLRFGETPKQSHKVGSAAVLTDDDHVVIDVYSDEHFRVYSLDYVSMHGTEPPRFPESLDELSCDVSYITEQGKKQPI